MNCPGKDSHTTWAGNHFLQYLLSEKYFVVEKGTIPASNQGFPTSLILEVSCLHFLHFIFTLSTQGLWGEFPSNFSQPSTALFFNSSLEPITSKLLHFWHSKIGKANPQYLFLEINQSCMFFNQSNSLSFPKGGIQFIFFVIS